ncbi:MAG: hypothetical protein HYS21_12590 [Deltaproteobacteria bacterium]|nr:hypothetical protein [Deltaproteobacteria bacterium]
MRLRIKPSGFLASVAEVITLLCAIIGASAVIGYLCAVFITPEWLAPGYPSFYRYPKNVEIKAILLAAAASIPVSIALARMSWAQKCAFSGFLFLLGLLISYKYLYFEDIFSWVVPAITLIILLSLLDYFQGRNTTHLLNLNPKPRMWLLCLAAFLGTAFIFLANIYAAYFFDESLDLHHFGEKFTSAIDFLNGGMPFVTFFWPHGLHDTGLTALFFYLGSSADLPTMSIALAMANSLGVITLLLLCIGMGLGYYSLLITFIAVVLSDMLLMPTYGLLLPVIISFLLFSRSKSMPGFILAGVVAFISYIYRIDYGVYGILSVFGYCLYSFAFSIISRQLTRLKEQVVSFFLYLAGLIASALFSYLLFGFPGSDWYRITMLTLPKFMADSTGFPYPLPASWLSALDYTTYTMQIGVFYLTSVLGIAAISARHLYTRFKEGSTVETGFFVLVLFLLAFSIRTALGRSAEDHILQFFGFSYLVLLLLISRGLVSLDVSRWLKGAIITALFIFLNFWTGSFGQPTAPPHFEVISESLQILAEHNDPKPKQCSNGIFSARNLSVPHISSYDRAVCSTRELLESKGINDGELFVVHSASLVYPSLGFRLPSKYYCLGWAITEEMQRELVAELEKNGVKAILRIRPSDGLRALATYDIPDSVRVPFFYEWFSNKFEIEKPLQTELGELYLLRN